MKPQKILILVSEASQKKRVLAKYLQEYLGQNIKVVLGEFLDVTFEINQEQSRAKLGPKNFADFDLVYFRRAWPRFIFLAKALATYLNSLKIKYFDSVFGEKGYGNDKLISSLRFSLLGLPIIPTYFCCRERINEKKDYIIQKFGLPLVAKRISAARGEGVFLIKKPQDFESLARLEAKGQFIFQKYFPSEEEYRLLVLGKRVAVFERKIRQKDEFRSNVSLGAKEEFLEVSNAPRLMREIAVRAAQALGLEIAGIDILVDKKGKIWLLEANRGPGLTYDPQFSPELRELATFFREQLSKEQCR